mgnify:CR=1 FL=1
MGGRLAPPTPLPGSPTRNCLRCILRKKEPLNQKKKIDAVGASRVLLVPLARWGLLNQRAAPPRPVNKFRLGRPPPTTEYVQGGRLKYPILNRRPPFFENFVSAKRHFLSSFSKDCNVSFGCSSLLETVGLPRLRKRCHASNQVMVMLVVMFCDLLDASPTLFVNMIEWKCVTA